MNKSIFFDSENESNNNQHWYTKANTNKLVTIYIFVHYYSIYSNTLIKHLEASNSSQ